MSSSSKGWFIDTRTKIEAGFAQWGYTCSRHPWKILLSVIAIVIYVSLSLPNIKVDTSTAGFLHKTDPVRVTYDQFQREFTRDEKVLVLIEGDVFSEAFLKRLEALHSELETIYQITGVDSLVNARMVYGEDDELIVEDLLEEFPETEEAMQTIQQRVSSNPFYNKHFINEDLDLTSIILTTSNYSELYDKENPPPFNERPFITGEEVGDIVNAVDEIVAKHQAEGFNIKVAGSPHMMHYMTVMMGRDMFVFSLIGIIAIAVILALLYQRFVMTVLPILVSVSSLFFTIALMVFFDITITTSIQILPSFLLAVGVGNSVHIFTGFFQGLNQGMEKQEALSYTLGHSGLAVSMTGLTTAGGLLSFMSSEIKPVADFGLVAPMGIMCALFFSLVMLPALISIVPIKNKALKDDSNTWYQRFLKSCATVSTQKPFLVIAVWIFFLVPALYLCSQLRISHTPLFWFPPEYEFRKATLQVDAEMGGSAFMEVIVDTGKTDGIKDPDVLNRIEQATNEALKLEKNGIQVGNVVSVVDIAKELNQALRANNPDYYNIAQDKQLLAQEFLLYEVSGDEDMQQIVNEDFSKARVTMQMPLADAILYPPYLDGVEEIIKKAFKDSDIEVVFSGVMVMMSRTVVAMLHSTVEAYILAFCIITPLMVFLIGSLRIGLLSMIPNLVPIILTMGLMQLVGIKLDAFTLLIGSIALGLAVDDTIHFMHNYQRFNAEYGNSAKAVYQTLKTTGQALLFTSMVLTIGFFVNMFATLENLFGFGLLTGFCIVVAFLADVLLAPAIVTLVDKYSKTHPQSHLADALG